MHFPDGKVRNEANDGKMDQIEKQIKTEENEASKSLDEVTSIVDEKSRRALLQAKTAYFEFMDVTAKVVKLSRQNSNIKSLELSLGNKRKQLAHVTRSL